MMKDDDKAAGSLEAAEDTGLVDIDGFCRMALGLEEESPGPCGLFWQWIKFVGAVLLLLPLRLLSLLILATVYCLVCQLSAPRRLCRSAVPADNLTPHTRAQRLWLRASGLLSRLFLLNCGFLWIREKRLPGNCFLRPDVVVPTVVANHNGPFDGFLLNYAMCGQLTAVAISWAAKMPVMSSIAKAHRVLAVHHGEGRKVDVAAPFSSTEPSPRPKSATDLIVEHQRRRAADPRFFSLLIFPEGCCTAERCLLQFRTGAFVAGEPVQPVVIRYPHRYVDLTWTDGIASLFLRALTQWVNQVELIWLPVYVPSSAEKDDCKLFAANVQKTMADAMQLPPERWTRTIGKKELTQWRSAQNQKYCPS